MLAWSGKGTHSVEVVEKAYVWGKGRSRGASECAFSLEVDTEIGKYFSEHRDEISERRKRTTQSPRYQDALHALWYRHDRHKRLDRLTFMFMVFEGIFSFDKTRPYDI